MDISKFIRILPFAVSELAIKLVKFSEKYYSFPTYSFLASIITSGFFNWIQNIWSKDNGYLHNIEVCVLTTNGVEPWWDRTAIQFNFNKKMILRQRVPGVFLRDIIQDCINGIIGMVFLYKIKEH